MTEKKISTFFSLFIIIIIVISNLYFNFSIERYTSDEGERNEEGERGGKINGKFNFYYLKFFMYLIPHCHFFVAKRYMKMDNTF